NPDLQEVHELRTRVVELAVGDAGPGAHPLNLPRTDDRARTEAVLVLERPIEHVGDDLHVPVRVSAEALARLHAVLVDHAKRTEAHELCVVVVGEGKRMVALEPAMLRVPALVSSSYFNHLAILSRPVSPPSSRRTCSCQRARAIWLFDHRSLTEL